MELIRLLLGSTRVQALHVMHGHVVILGERRYKLACITLGPISRAYRTPPCRPAPEARKMKPD
jgi:hypothetical protein